MSGKLRARRTVEETLSIRSVLISRCMALVLFGDPSWYCLLEQCIHHHHLIRSEVVIELNSIQFNCLDTSSRTYPHGAPRNIRGQRARWCTALLHTRCTETGVLQRPPTRRSKVTEYKAPGWRQTLEIRTA